MSEDKLTVELIISETGADDERLEQLSNILRRDIHELGDISVRRKTDDLIESGIKGDSITWGALVLVTLPAFLPQILAFIQNWVSDRRKIVVEAPNGAKIEFTPSNNYSETEILNLIEKLNTITNIEIE